MIIQTLNAEHEVKPAALDDKVAALQGIVEEEEVTETGAAVLKEVGLVLPMIVKFPPYGRAHDEKMNEIGITPEERRLNNGRIGPNSWDD